MAQIENDDASSTLSVIGSVTTTLQLTEAELAANYTPVTETIDDAGQTATFTGVPVYDLIQSAGYEYPSGKNGNLRDIIQASGTGGGPVVVSEGEIDPNFGGANTAATDIIAYEEGTTTIAPELIVPGDVNGGIGGRDIGVSTLDVETATVPSVGTAGGVTTQFTVGGDVANPADPYTVGSVQAIGSVQQTDTYFSGTTPQTLTFTGAPLFTLLNAATLTDSNILNDYVVAEGSDGYAVAYSVGEIDPTYRAAPDALVAYDDGTGTYPSIGGGDGDFRTTAPYDSKGGRYVSNLATIFVGGAASPPCFVAGTRIATATGETAVETLAPGDLVRTRAGEVRPVVWIGNRRVACARHPAPEKVLPIRIGAGAFGQGLPRRDVLLSPDHAVFAEGVLIQAKYLVDGVNVVREPAERVHYFHVELGTHDILLAEGLPVESYLDTGNRATFANGAAHMALHPDFSPLSWDQACAPLCTSGRKIEDLRRRIAFRTATEIGLRVVAAGVEIAPAAVKGRLHRFLLPGRARHVRIVSASGRVGDRRLGVCLGGLVADGRPVALDSLSLGAGFCAADGESCRWMTGDAELALEPASARRVLDLLVIATFQEAVAAGTSRARQVA